MASLYQRFTGKINTSRSFPAPPEASRLLGGQGAEEDGGAGTKPLGPQAQAAAPRERGGGGAGGRPRFQYQARSDCDEEDVRASRWVGGGGGLWPSAPARRRGLEAPRVLGRPPRLPSPAPKRPDTLLSAGSLSPRSGAGLCLRWRQPRVGGCGQQGFGAAPAGIWNRLGRFSRCTDLFVTAGCCRSQGGN